MLQNQLPIIESYTGTTLDVREFSAWDYERIEEYLDSMNQLVPTGSVLKSAMIDRKQTRFESGENDDLLTCK